MGEHLETVAVHGDRAFVELHGALIGAIGRVVFEQVGIRSGVREVVDGYDIELPSVPFVECAKRESSDPTKTVDAYARCHDVVRPLEMIGLYLSSR